MTTTNTKKKISQKTKVFPTYFQKYFTFLFDQKDFSDQTIEKYFYDLRIFYDFLLFHIKDVTDYSSVSLQLLNRISTTDIESYILFLSCYTKNGQTIRNSAAGIRRKIFALRSFMDYLVTSKLVESNPANDVVVERPHSSNFKPLKNKEYNLLIDNVSTGNGLSESRFNYSSRSQYRDTAIIQLFLRTDIKVSDLVNLDLSDVDLTRGTLHISKSGGTSIILDLHEDVTAALSDYINNERPAVDDGNFALFLSSRRNENTRLGIRSIEKIVKKYGETIDRHVTPTTLRYCKIE